MSTADSAWHPPPDPYFLLFSCLLLRPYLPRIPCLIPASLIVVSAASPGIDPFYRAPYGVTNPLEASWRSAVNVEHQVGVSRGE